MKLITGTPYFVHQDKILGKGSFGTVYLASHREEPELRLACKIMHPTAQGEINKLAIDESVVLKQIESEHVVRVFKTIFTSTNKIYIFMEYCEESLHSKIKGTTFARDQLLDFLDQFCDGYSHLRRLHVLHCDIKPENILIRNGVYKIADFGLSEIAKAAFTARCFKGSLGYVAPQYFEKRLLSDKNDLFALGCILFRLIEGQRLSLGCKNHAEFVQKIRSGIQFKSKQIGEDVLELVRAMLQPDWQKRLSWDELDQRLKQLKFSSLNQQKHSAKSEQVHSLPVDQQAQKVSAYEVFDEKSAPEQSFVSVRIKHNIYFEATLGDVELVLPYERIEQLRNVLFRRMLESGQLQASMVPWLPPYPQFSRLKSYIVTVDFSQFHTLVFIFLTQAAQLCEAAGLSVLQLIESAPANRPALYDLGSKNYLLSHIRNKLESYFYSLKDNPYAEQLKFFQHNNQPLVEKLNNLLDNLASKRSRLNQQIQHCKLILENSIPLEEHYISHADCTTELFQVIRRVTADHVPARLQSAKRQMEGLLKIYSQAMSMLEPLSLLKRCKEAIAEEGERLAKQQVVSVAKCARSLGRHFEQQGAKKVVGLERDLLDWSDTLKKDRQQYWVELGCKFRHLDL